jgi:hypothetical protein
VTKPWEDVRESVRVKLIEHGEETYVFVRSQGRRDKEQSMRRRRLKKLINRLRELQQQNLTRDELLLKLGAARKEAGKAYALLVIYKGARQRGPVARRSTRQSGPDLHKCLDASNLKRRHHLLVRLGERPEFLRQPGEKITLNVRPSS